MDIPALISLAANAATALATAVGLADKLREMVDGGKAGKAEMMPLLLDIYRQLLDAKRSQMTLEEALRTLQREQADRDQRDLEFARYALAPTPEGDLVYYLKKGSENGEPPHCICPNCKANGYKSILQTEGSGLFCHRCKALFADQPLGL